jgi:peptidoglycan/xylan/chitin deacetylase (PgdA/CDA1 family)
MIRMTGKRTIFPFYHLVSDEDVPHVRHLYKVRSIKEFTADLDFLLRYYKPISIKEYLDSIKRGHPLPGNNFILSFDDGLREFHDIAAPILLRKGIPAICFLNSDFIDNHFLFYRYKASLLINSLKDGGNELVNKKNLLQLTYADNSVLNYLAVRLKVNFSDYLEEHRPYLDSIQIRKLIQQGFSFGSHSIDHPEYRLIPEDEQIRQTEESLTFIRFRFGIMEKLFCFPFTDHGVKQSFFDKVFDPMHPIADLTFGGAGMKNDTIARNIQRIPFEGTSLTGNQILKTEYLYYMIKSIFGKNTIKR